jgi:hypothetical protein
MKKNNNQPGGAAADVDAGERARGKAAGATAEAHATTATNNKGAAIGGRVSARADSAG